MDSDISLNLLLLRILMLKLSQIWPVGVSSSRLLCLLTHLLRSLNIFFLVHVECFSLHTFSASALESASSLRNSVWECLLLHSLAKSDFFFFFFNFCQFDSWEIASRCNLNLYFFHYKWNWTSFNMSKGYMCVCVYKYMWVYVFSHVLCPFFCCFCLSEFFIYYGYYSFICDMMQIFSLILSVAFCLQ